jgi:hypothetical protein
VGYRYVNTILDQVDSKRIALHQQMQEHEDRMRYLFHHINDVGQKHADFLIEDFLPKGCVAILAGDPKVGKTALATAIALAVAEGTPFAGMKAKRAGVLWLALEESPQERAMVTLPVKERLAETDFFITYDKVAIDSPDGINELRTWRNEIDAGLIVVDPLHAAHSGRSLADGWGARKTLAALKTFCNHNGVSALLLHHIGRKSMRVAENAQLAACAGMSMLLTARREEEGRIITLRCAGRGDHANRVLHFASRNPLDYESTEPPKPQPKQQRVIESEPLKYRVDDDIVACLVLADGARSASFIAGQLQRNPNSIRNALARLLAKDRVRLVSIESRVKYYSHVKTGKSVGLIDEKSEVNVNNSPSKKETA